MDMDSDFGANKIYKVRISNIDWEISSKEAADAYAEMSKALPALPEEIIEEIVADDEDDLRYQMNAYLESIYDGICVAAYDSEILEVR